MSRKPHPRSSPGRGSAAVTTRPSPPPSRSPSPSLSLPRYIGWRVSDWRVAQAATIPPSEGSGPNRYRRGACSVCGEPTWFHSVLIEDRVLVCWPCAGGVAIVPHKRGGT
jgi:hypothetical protein